MYFWHEDQSYLSKFQLTNVWSVKMTYLSWSWVGAKGNVMLWVSPFAIGHLRAAVSFIFKASLSVKLFTWKLIMFAYECKLINFIIMLKTTRILAIIWFDKAMLRNIMQIIIEWFHRFTILANKKNEGIYNRLPVNVRGNKAVFLSCLVLNDCTCDINFN